MYALLQSASVVALVYAIAWIPRHRVRTTLRGLMFDLGRMLNSLASKYPRWKPVYRKVVVDQVENLVHAIDAGLIDGLHVDNNELPVHPQTLDDEKTSMMVHHASCDDDELAEPEPLEPLKPPEPPEPPVTMAVHQRPLWNRFCFCFFVK